jgi:hypothetical protein
MAASGGWSETAGPWVKPEQGMKRYVWSETVVEGPGKFNGKLRQPPAVLGKFQDLMSAPQSEDKRDLTLPGAKPQPEPAKREPTRRRFMWMLPWWRFLRSGRGCGNGGAEAGDHMQLRSDRRGRLAGWVVCEVR